MRAFIDRFLRSRPPSKEDAKARLKVLLIHDQVDLTPVQLTNMRAEIMEVISRYVEFDDERVAFALNEQADGVALVSTVPVRRVTARA